MSTSQEYTISRKVSDTEEEIIQIPYSALANKPDLSVYQTKTDASLATTDKTVVGAINEVVTGVAGTLESFGKSLAPQENGKLNKKVYVYPDGYFSQGTSYDASKDLYLSIGDGLALETIDEANNIWNIKSGSAITSVDGLGGGAISGNVSTSGSLTVGGSLTVNGTTTTVDSTTLQVKDKLIEVAHDNTTKLTTPAGLVAPKYDGTNSGALVFDGDGTAYVGDVTLDSAGNIDVSKSELQPLATRTGLVGGNLVQYDSTAQTLKDSGKKISDLATTSQVNAKYTKPSGGIPKTDLASSVQTSLGKADTALQSAPVTSVNGKTGAVTIDVPSAVTSIDGLGGGTLTSPITLTGGDSTTASKIILDTNGQITDTGTATLFGRSSGNLIVGSGSYPTTFRGKQTRPTYNGNDMALKSDIPSVPTNYVTTDGQQEISALKTFTSAQGVGSCQGAFRVFVSKEEMDNYYAKFATGDATSTDITFTSMTNKAFLARTNNTNRTAYKDAGIDVWKPSGKHSFLFPEKSGTLAVTSDIPDVSNFVKSNSGAFTGNLTADNFNSRFSLQSVPYGTAVGENADLNTVTYLSVGNYYCGADAIVSTMTNVPVKRAFMMTVYSPLTPTVDNETTGKWVYRVRKFMTYLGEEYIQSVYSGNTAGTFTYGAWQQIAHKSDIPSVPTFSLSGTTLTITL